MARDIFKCVIFNANEVLRTWGSDCFVSYFVIIMLSFFPFVYFFTHCAVPSMKASCAQFDEMKIFTSC